jgi:mannose-6-phosphate isomerase-like protein (cupin superfamily)
LPALALRQHILRFTHPKLEHSMRDAIRFVVTAAILAGFAPAIVSAQNPAAPAGAEVVPPLSNTVQILSTSRLAALADSLPPGASTAHQIARFDGLSNMISRRDTSGIHERHEGFTDIFVVQRGRARLLYGGTVEGERASGQGEWRGGTIRNGAETEIKAGDIVVIPAGIPHQLLLTPKESFYYFVFKVAKAPAR